MEGLSIHNFKSYRKLTIFGFNPYINVIIGGNGQGKSNIFKALAFSLSDRLQINRTQFNNCLHRGIDVSTDQDIEVEVVLRENDQSEELVKVAKIWKTNLTEECYINSKLTKMKQFENFIDGLCLSYTNPYNIVQQGKINQIILMDQFQLYRLLEEITGMKKFNKRKEEALSLMNKVSIQKKQILIVLEELEEKLKSLEVRKEEFQFFSVEEKTKKFRARKHLVELLEATRHNLEKIKNEYNEVSENLAKILQKKKSLEQNMEDANFSIKLQKQKLALIQREEIGGTQIVAETQELKELERKQKQLHKELKQHAKQIKERDRQIETFKRNFSELQQKYENMKLNREVNKPKQNKDKVVLALQADIKLEQKRLEQISEDKQNTNKKIQEIQKLLKMKKNIDQEENYEKLQAQKQQISQKRQQQKKINSQLAWQRNVASIQTESLKQIVHQAQIKLRKVLPSLDFGLLEHLRSSNTRGVYGYFIEFVKIDPSVNFAYQMAGISRLCSLVVENEQACIAVIETNRKLKGRQINIIQLDYMRGRPADSQAIPKQQNVHKLSNSKWIKLNTTATQKYSEQFEKDIEKLIKNTFDRYALVKDYETGLKVSKEYHINCITGDREIVYSEGYHCKLGQQNTYKENNLDLYSKFQEKKQNYLEKLGEKQELERRIVENENEEINLINKENKLDAELNKSLFSFNQIKTQRKMLESYKKNNDQLLKNQKDLQASLKRKKNALTVINSNNSKNKEQFKMSKTQCDKIEAEYSTKRKQLNKMLTQIYGIEQTIQKLSTQKQEIDNLVIKAKNNRAAGVPSVGLVSREIVSGLRQRQDQVQEFQKEIEELSKIQKEIQGNKDHLEVKLITYRAEEEDIEKNIEQIGEIEENVEQLQELSNSMSVSMLHGRRKNYHFSAKDKLLFTKFSNIFESFNQNKKSFKQLEQAEQKIKKRIEQYQNENQVYMNDVAGKFEREFKQIFSFIVNRGHAEVRLKKISEKIRDVIKYNNCLTVMVSFTPSEQAMKKWNDFSGGEKTVIAISMILALQRCEPAPFYVLDEIDSALDPVYIQKIAELLSRESQKNKCQYFISSFKEDMMSFPEEICNYYLVSGQNRQSSIEKIKQSNAVDILRTFIVKR